MSRLHSSNRREFLQTALIAGVSAHAAQQHAPGPAPKIIDTHTHFYDPSRPQGVPWPPKSDAVLYKTVLPPQFREMTQPFGVRGTIAIEASPWLEDNDWILNLAKNNPIIVGFMGHLEPGKPEFRGNLERFAKNALFRGIRLNDQALATGLKGGSYIADLQRMAELDLALDAIGDETIYSSLVGISDQIPELRIIVDHMPLDPPSNRDARVQAEIALGHLRQRPQIYSKVSGVLRRVNGVVPHEMGFYKARLDALWDTFGPERLVYGSNWPVSEHVAPYATVLKVVRDYFEGKGPEASEKYFWKNSAAFYKWVART